MNFIILGPPGVGKGTQAVKLAGEYGLPHISTGDMFRDAVARGTEVGKKAHGYMAAGELVPDEIVIEIVRERLTLDDAKDGFILDGFPRTIAQAEALDALLSDIKMPLSAVIDFSWDEDVLVQRLSGRRICKDCGASFHVQNLPVKQEGVCDVCGGQVIQREDDRPEAVRTRLNAYREKTAALTGFYRDKGLLEMVDSLGSVDEVFGQITKVIEKRTKHDQAEVS